MNEHITIPRKKKSVGYIHKYINSNLVLIVKMKRKHYGDL